VPPGLRAAGRGQQLVPDPDLPARVRRGRDDRVPAAREGAGMTSPPTADASPGRTSPGGRENVFTHKIGPLPMWGWLAIVGGALVAWRLYSNRSGSSTQPKPTTTIAGWTYPAPTGLQAYDVAAKGVRLSWNAVTGPKGQHPNSYTVATYDSKNKLVDQFQTTAGNTNTAEYGKGGKGLPKGTYHSN